VTQDRLIHALVQSKNEAADDALLEALQLGTNSEKQIALDALMQRKTTHGLCGVIEQYEQLSGALQTEILSQIRTMHHAVREAGRSARPMVRLSAMKLIAMGHQGKLAYVLSENLHEPDPQLSKAAVDAMVALARWVTMQTRWLQRNPPVVAAAPAAQPDPEQPGGEEVEDETTEQDPRIAIYQELLDQRPEIEQTVARAMDGHRGKHGVELLRAALLLCDWPGSKTLAMLNTAKHGGQSAMVRRLQQAPAAEHVEAFLLGASHGGLRSHFGIAFSHIEEAPALDALLRKTYWLKDNALHTCAHLISRGAWWGETELARDISRRTAADAARIGDWLAASGIHDVVQDERMDRLRRHAADDFSARLRLFRLAAGRRRGASVHLLKSFLIDTDERLVRMAAREIVRRRPADFENPLLQIMTTAPDSVRRVIARAVGQSGFEQFWGNFERLDKNTRKQAGRAMFKLLPDATQRLSRRLSSGTPEQRIKAMQIVQELKLADTLQDRLIALCSDQHPRLRSKAVTVLGEVPTMPPDVLIERLLIDTDPRVRANMIEVLETNHKAQFVPILIQRARAGTNRERANAIRVLHKLRMGYFDGALVAMLRDERPEHRISAMWALKETNWWKQLGEIGRMAKEDANLRVRRYALGVLKAVSEMVRQQRKNTAG
jgi:HEAT repeat protein